MYRVRIVKKTKRYRKRILFIVERTSEVESESLHFRESDDNKRLNTAYYRLFGTFYEVT
jgi:hypothetical protein